MPGFSFCIHLVSSCRHGHIEDDILLCDLSPYDIKALCPKGAQSGSVDVPFPMRRFGRTALRHWERHEDWLPEPDDSLPRHGHMDDHVGGGYLPKTISAPEEIKESPVLERPIRVIRVKEIPDDE